VAEKLTCTNKCEGECGSDGMLVKIEECLCGAAGCLDSVWFYCRKCGFAIYGISPPEHSLKLVGPENDQILQNLRTPTRGGGSGR